VNLKRTAYIFHWNSWIYDSSWTHVAQSKCQNSFQTFHRKQQPKWIFHHEKLSWLWITTQKSHIFWHMYCLQRKYTVKLDSVTYPMEIRLLICFKLQWPKLHNPFSR